MVWPRIADRGLNAWVPDTRETAQGDSTMADGRRCSRRRFVKRSALLACAGLAAPYVIPCGVLAGAGVPGANDRVGIGMIGCGRRAHQLLGDLRSVTGAKEVARIVAVSDIWPKKWEEWIAAYEKDMPVKQGKYGMHLDYRHLLDRADVDAVVVATGDHWHALPAIHACQAGKDVYGEKPLTLTVREGRAMVQAVRKYRRVFQTGSQQRSYLRNRQACELVRNGRLGPIREVICTNYESSRPAGEFKLREESSPLGMDWDRWCGQTPLVPFSMNRYLTYEKPGWQGLREYSGGLLTNWGAHGLDMVQWALGTDQTGPVEIEPHGNQYNSKITFRYESGILLKLAADGSVLGGGHFIGSKGEMFMTRGKFHTVPSQIAKEQLTDRDVHLHQSDDHMRNWLQCIKSRELCAADVEIGHRTATICHLGGIARRLGRKLRWDPDKEVFPGDEEANALLDRPKRKPYELPDPV
jgi:predicted dehydrogenase